MCYNSSSGVDGETQQGGDQSCWRGRTLDDLLRVRALGVPRAGATATGLTLDEAVMRGIGLERKEIAVPLFP
jgi:hypothetical protein